MKEDIFYRNIKYILGFVILVSLIMALASCELVNLNMLRPDDLPDPEPIDIDTTVVDTVVTPVDTITHIDTPCIPQLYTEPKFVTGYMEVTNVVTSDMILYVHPYSVTVSVGENYAHKLDSLLRLYDPSLTYDVFSTDWRHTAFIAKGTNDKEHFHGEVQLKLPGINANGFSCITQGYLFGGALTFDEFMYVIENYPSVNYINFRNTNWTQEQYVMAAMKILECRLGRYLIDFRFNLHPIPDSIPPMFEAADWQTVLH